MLNKMNNNKIRARDGRRINSECFLGQGQRDEMKGGEE
jgi:hypothetical protein